MSKMYTKLPEEDLDENTDPLPPYKPPGRRSIIVRTMSTIRQIITIERLIIFALLGVLIPCIPLAISSANCIPQPKFDLRPYGSNIDYMTLDHGKDFLWLNLTFNDTKGSGGLVYASDGNEDGKETVGMISMFHQLHCLGGLRMALQNASEGKWIGVDYRDNEHWPHCMDYLRQTLLCNADDYIERPVVINGTQQHFISGADDIRKCGNPELLYQRVAEHGY